MAAGGLGGRIAFSAAERLKLVLDGSRTVFYPGGMAYPAGSARCALQGSVTNGEIFEVTFALGNVLVANVSEANILAGRIATHFASDLGPATLPLLGTDCSWKSLALYCYPDGGTKATFVGQATISGTGTGTGFCPLQNACVVTLNTGFAGRSNRGRMYFPASGGTIASGHFLPSTPVANLVPALATFFQDIATDVTASAQAQVISQKSSTGRAVTQVVADLRPDTQRRRANKQPRGTITQATVAV